jgi:hypothetical protein
MKHSTKYTKNVKYNYAEKKSTIALQSEYNRTSYEGINRILGTWDLFLMISS